MANKIKEGKFANTSPRQKGVAIAVVIVVLILIWQVMGFFSSSTPKPSPKPAAAPPTTGKISANGPMPSGAAPVAHEVNELAQGKIVNDPGFIKMQKATEEKYVVKLNELEELRIQRQIAEMNQGIAAAKLATVTAEKDISDLLTKPAMQAQPIPDSVYSTQLVNPSAGNPPIPPPPVTNPIAEYTLISVSMQLHKWSAVLGYQGKLLNVSIGDTLPDSSTVVAITKNNIVLKKDGETKKIGIVSSI